MKAKKQDRKAAKAPKPALKAQTLKKTRTLGLTQNHNETLVRYY